MSFTPGIPASGQSLGASRTQVEGNFANYNTVVSQDHVAPNATGQGKHVKSTYTATTDPVTIANEAAVYTKSAGGLIELFFARASAGAIIQMTSGSVVAGANGQSFLPGGVQIKWGQKPAGATGTSVTVTYTTQGLTAFPNNFFVGFAIANNSGRIFQITSGSTTTIVVGASPALGAGDNFYWVAIGN